MLKLVRYMKKYWVLVLLCIGLVAVQSQTELALPDYMSNIVTNGIQMGGFTSPVSDVLSEETYDHIMLLASDNDQDIIASSYEYKTSFDAATLDEFPLLTSGYKLKDLTSEETQQLESALLKPMIMISSIDSVDLSQISQQYPDIPEGASIYDVLALLGRDTIDEMLTSIDAEIETMGESSMLIAAGNAVKSEYEQLGCDVDSISNNYIIREGIVMLAIALVSMIAAMASALVSARVGAGIAKDLRQSVFEKVESFNNSEFNKFSTATLITRTTNDVTQVQSLMVMMLRMFVYAPLIGVGALYRAIVSSPSMTWIIALVLIVILGGFAIAMVVVLPKFRIIQSLIDKLNLTMRENLNGVLVIRAFGNEKHSEERFDKANTDLTKVNLFVNRTMALLMPLMTFVMNIATILVVWFGARQIDIGTIAIGQMMAFIQYAMYIIMAFLFIAMIFVMLPRASVAADRINEVLATDNVIKDPEDPQPFKEDKKGYVEFKDVSFKYPGSDVPVLSHIDFTAKPGETTAFIGSTGCGKSTLINLIPRFYDVSEGEVLVDGVDVRSVNQHDLRDKLGIVPQKGSLLSGTIKSNLKYGAKDASDEELEEVVHIAQADDIIEEKPNKMDEEIAQGGTNVSGGQKQRLAIARALAKKSEILIFDDSFSALDFKTDASLRKELAKLMDKEKSTVLIVGQRIASIMDAKQIIVLDEGKIVGKGTHQELLENCEVYREIAYSQLSKEELENA